MITQNRHNLSGRILLTLATGMLALVTQSARAVGLTYVDADAFNLAPIGAITGPSNGGDNLWFQRAGFGSGSTLFESNNAIEDSPELTQTVFVAPGAYDV